MATSKTTFPLYGYERFHAMAPAMSARVAHVLALRGDVSTLATLLPQAVVATFNQHPKMRVTVLPGTSQQKAMIGSPLVDVAELTEHSYSFTWREHEEDTNAWEQFVERECNQHVNREQQWPYTVHVFADKTTQRFARIVVLADAYMADVASCAYVANAVLANAALVSSGSPLPEEKPLAPSLYECMHSVNPVLGIVSEAISKWLLQPLFNFDHAGFTPALPVDTAAQADYDGKPPATANQSKALFASGKAATMKHALERCTQEGVSLRGVSTAATMLAIGLAKHHGSLRNAPQLAVKVDASFNLRDEDDQLTDAVGMYSLPGNLVFTSSQGVDVSSSFWELARRSELEWNASRHSHELKLQSMYVHETLTADNGKSGLQVKHGILSDACVSVSGTDAHPQEITLSKAGGAATTLHVEAAHSFTSQPALSAACSVVVSVTTSFNYSMMTKLESEAAAEVFHWFVEIMEHMGEFQASDSLLQASDKLLRQARVGPMPSSADAATTPSKTNSASV